MNFQVDNYLNSSRWSFLPQKRVTDDFNASERYNSAILTFKTEKEEKNGEKI